MLKQRKMKVILSVLFVSVIISAVTISASAKLVISDTYKLELSKSSNSTISLTQDYDRQDFIFRFEAYPTIKKVSGTNVSSDTATATVHSHFKKNYGSKYENFDTRKTKYTFYENMTSGPIVKFSNIPEDAHGSVYFDGNDNYVRTYYTIQQFTK